MHHNPFNPLFLTFTDFFFGMLALVATIFYLAAVYRSNRNGRLRQWPVHRTVFWLLGVIVASIAVIGPLAYQSHTNFTLHMVGHLLLGMLAPLLLLFAAPMTLFLRTVDVETARAFTRLVRKKPFRYFTHPVVTTVLNIGGLWLLYTTELFMLMHNYLWLHIIIHIHVFLAGYLFTISLVYLDPVPHRFTFTYRTVVFIIALAGHGILSKFIYAYPPDGVALEQAQAGAMLMYYGGDAIDLVLIIILFRQWYKSGSSTADKKLVQFSVPTK